MYYKQKADGNPHRVVDKGFYQLTQKGLQDCVSLLCTKREDGESYN